MFHRLVSDVNLGQGVALHFRLDFHLVGGIAVVHADHHPGKYDHATQVGLDHLGFLRVLLGHEEKLEEGV